MIDPVIFSFKLFNLQVTLTWYGLIVMSSVLIGAWLAEKEIRRRGENGEALMDAMIWAIVGGILGARLWYVINAIIGGNRSYIEDPLSIIRPPIAGLHFFGGLLFGAFILILYLRRNGYDSWLFLDAIAPVALLGQALGRLGNFINQELYGPPTTLPWGIAIPADHRLADFADLAKFPVETTRFHPTFAYEMVLNVLAYLFILWYSRQNEEEIKPGAVFSLWLIFAGFIRTFIEFFRPDQPNLGETFITTSMLVAFLMGVAGVILFLARIGRLQLAFADNLPDEYFIKKADKNPASLRTRKLVGQPEADDSAESESAPEMPTAKRKTPARSKTPVKKTAEKKATTSKTRTKK
jgi:phosphatidylglycerol:prolipoprotein diacylglycerol transferase